MGDRSNIVFKQSGNDQVWLYSHWGGEGIQDKVRPALAAARKRWDDEPYATKIMLYHLIDEADWKPETGNGISCRMLDNEHPILVVDFSTQSVYKVDEIELNGRKIPADYKPKNPITFFDYTK